MSDDLPTLPLNLTPRGISLLEFNGRIKRLLHHSDVLDCWVTAETADLKVSRGHCYMELLQKDERSNTIARLGAVIWASAYSALDAKFFAITGNHLVTGMKVLVKVNATFHELYGMKAVITDIDPQYTLGDMERQRLEILKRLKEEGIIDENKALGWPLVPQRIAIISAASAAGYGDFMNQLHGNAYGLAFYTCLFPAAMQGDNTVPSVLQALSRIDAHANLFDCVVIIRGGGSTSDLNSFDNYDLAARIATFPLPVITGIGHERDTTVLDYVAALRVKTPTAAAEFLIKHAAEQLTRLEEIKNAVSSTVREAVSLARKQLDYYADFIPLSARQILERGQMRLEQHTRALPLVVGKRLDAERARLRHLAGMTLNLVPQALSRERLRLGALDDKVQILSPRNTLNRGYSLTMKNGHVVTSSSQLAAGDTITTHFKDGASKSTITTIK